MKRFVITLAASLVCGLAIAQTWSPPPAASPNSGRNNPTVAVVNPDGTKVGSGTLTVTLPTAQLTPGLTVATTSGSVALGTRGVTFITSSDFSGTILGATITGTAPGGGLTWSAPGEHTNAAFAYTISAGTLYILTER